MAQQPAYLDDDRLNHQESKAMKSLSVTIQRYGTHSLQGVNVFWGYEVK